MKGLICDYSVEIIQTEAQLSSRRLKKKKVPDLWAFMRRSKIPVKGVPNREKRMNELKTIVEKILAKNFPKLKKINQLEF